MILDDDNLRTLYEAYIAPSGHPDPIGYLARVMLTSEGDPDYVDINGKVGFMPVHPQYAYEMVGATEVQSLQNNVIATIHMDIMLFQSLQDLERMVIAFHDGLGETNASEETQGILDALDEARTALVEILFPRLATVEDVIQFIQDSDTQDVALTKARKDFYEYLADGRPS